MSSNSSGSGRFVSERTTKKIPVADLQIGMWISELDRDWLGTPFMMQGFRVNTMDEIQTVAKYCQHVWVDGVEETWSGREQKETIKPRPKPRVIKNQTSSTEENQRISGVYKQARSITRSILDEIRLTSLIDTDKAKDVVNDCVGSVIRNPDALLWLSKIRSRDEYTSEHCLNVCIMAIAFGRQLGYEGKELFELGVCGLLHDVGKMKVPDEVLNKPGKLTDDEFNIIKSHTEIGRDLLMAAGSDSARAVEAAWCHHERVDGSGYPRGLKGNEISRTAMIISIVDAFDAMTAERCYKPSMSPTEALKIMYDSRGKHFDSDLVDQFIQTVGLYPPGTVVELVNGQAGLVIEANPSFKHLPKIIVLCDELKQPIEEQLIDLSLVQRGKLGKEFLIRNAHVDGAFGISVREYQAKGKLVQPGAKDAAQMF
ncbi:HD-GYP domain-containing protein [Halioxenophilus aromaticivorans]|uniref:HD-GYP domain-containing protein n=1 Tax=Halioxenophilus aromaticivorans TaxID=1306992 RepID=UPI0031E79D20